MKLKKKGGLPLKEMLFTYLAVSKLWYWFNNIVSIIQSDFEGAGEAILMRFLSQDLMFIVSITSFFVLEKIVKNKSKHKPFVNTVIIYSIFFAAMLGFIYLYVWILGLFWSVSLPPLPVTMGMILIFIVVSEIFFRIKGYLKKKEKEID